MRAHHFRKWLPALAWTVVILSLSGERGASPRTGYWIEQLLGDLSHEALFYINYSLRKGAHVVGYGILGWLNFRALDYRRPGVALALAALVAIIDETHQGTSPLRTPSLADVGFDVCGAALAVMVERGRPHPRSTEE